ncbi:MAG: OmpA family protein [Prevotella sp.]|nr:OmpA family protein [Prevotella sp.]MCM1075552.1 OmpA family protein [Ruminococcus sp.]
MRRLWISLAISAVGLLSAYAAKPEEGSRIAALDNLSNEELIMSVPLGKQAELVSKFQEKEAVRLLKSSVYNPKKTGCNVEMYRDKEVIIITIPATNLFTPNDTELLESASTYLDPIKRYLSPQKADMYRVLLVMHTDNTGSTSYTDNLSLERVESVYEYLDNAGVDIRYLFPTAAGATDPIYDNNSVEGRAGNRRLEIYLIPGTLMRDQAKSGRIAL